MTAVLVGALVTGVPSDPDAGAAEQEPTDDGIYLGPDVNDHTMGRVVVVERSLDIANNTIKYRAEPYEGYRFINWTDLDGNVLEEMNVMSFAADKDREAVAVFGPVGVISLEYTWYQPIFGDDGTVTYGEPTLWSFTLDESIYRSSIKDSGIQRTATNENPSPVRLCMSDGIVADIAERLNGVTEGMTNLKKAIIVLSFVQDVVDYQIDRDQYGDEEFWTTPMETMYSGYGDCEDTATLFVSIASVMGLDCGFVMFEHDRWGNSGTGHMSVAVGLAPGESIGGDVATFTFDGVTYAYCETAVDPYKIDGFHPAVGLLSTSYSITDGKWTHITYDADDGTFSAGRNLAINGGSASSVGEVVYGDLSNPPAVEMAVGDTFTYRPMTNLSSVITASGDGLSFLTFDQDEGVLSGTATAPGTYCVYLDARSTVGPEQHAVQTVTLIVNDSEGGNSGYELMYGSSGWVVEESVTASEGVSDDTSPITMNLVVIAIALAVAGLMVGRMFS